MKRLVLIACTFALVTSCASESHASLATRAQRIEGQVWSPYCPGKLLIDCTTVQAGQLRARITHELRAGRSDDQILNDIRRDFGNEALARPPSGRTGLLIWLVPFAVFALGAFVVLTVVRRRRHVIPSPLPPLPRVDPALDRLRNEVRRDI